MYFPDPTRFFLTYKIEKSSMHRIPTYSIGVSTNFPLTNETYPITIEKGKRERENADGDGGRGGRKKKRFYPLFNKHDELLQRYIFQLWMPIEARQRKEARISLIENQLLISGGESIGDPIRIIKSATVDR